MCKSAWSGGIWWYDNFLLRDTLCKSAARELIVQPMEKEYVLGPLGNEKTVSVSKLCKLQELLVPESKTFVAASSNSACDAVVLKFAASDLIVVRAYALCLEREMLMKPYFVAKRKEILVGAGPLPDIHERSESTYVVLRQRTVEFEESGIVQGAESAFKYFRSKHPPFPSPHICHLCLNG